MKTRGRVVAENATYFRPADSLSAWNHPGQNDGGTNCDPRQVSLAEQAAPLTAQYQVGRCRTEEIDGRLRSLGQNSQANAGVSDYPGHDCRPAAHLTPRPQKERPTDQRNEDTFCLSLKPRREHLPQRAESGGRGQGAQAR